MSIALGVPAGNWLGALVGWRTVFRLMSLLTSP